VNLSDPEILELSGLCSALVDGTLSPAQRARLSDWLGSSEEARRHYVRVMGQSASLHLYAAELQTEAAVRQPASLAAFPVLMWASSLAAALALGAGLWFAFRGAGAPDSEPVAQLTASKGCEWTGPALVAGGRVRSGQRLELLKGLAEITFDSGARVVLQAPASLEVNSAWEATLRRGTLSAKVPHEAIGFRVSNPSVDVVDLGTEFTMIADLSGTAEVLVSKGEVEAAPRTVTEPETILLKERESRRFAPSGVSPIANSAQIFDTMSKPISLDRFSQATRFAYWNFEGAAAGRFLTGSSGLPSQPLSLTFEGSTPASVASAHIPGFKGQALHFDGALYGRTSFPGLSGSGSHTVTFWIRVPLDAELSDAVAALAWATNVEKLRARPVQIGWNRNPNEGTLGAIRTDFGGGCAIGTTPLRDGRWHHLAVVFAPGSESATPVQVKQYVDGRLESGSIIPGTVHAPRGTPAEIASIRDVLWLGCRLGLSSPRKDRFRGDLEDLSIADRGLEPREIVALMQTNHLPPDTLLAVRANPSAKSVD